MSILIHSIVTTIDRELSKKEMREYVQNNTPLAWFRDHPIVSAVLWILGHDMSKPINRIDQYSQNTPYSPSSGNKSPGLSWKDDHGGNIAEYIQEVQGKSDSPIVIEGSDTDDSNKQIRINRDRNLDKNEEIPVAECSPSPQWGFYIPITPPIDQVYSSKTSSLKVELGVKGLKTSQKSSMRQTRSNTLQ